MSNPSLNTSTSGLETRSGGASLIDFTRPWDPNLSIQLSETSHGSITWPSAPYGTLFSEVTLEDPVIGEVRELCHGLVNAIPKDELSRMVMLLAEFQSSIVPEVAKLRTTAGWFNSVSHELRKLVDLEDGWDSYGARRVDKRAIKATEDLLSDISEPGSNRPTVGPAVSGGVQIEWHTADADLEIEVESSGLTLIVFHQQAPDKVVWDGPIADRQQLRQWVQELSGPGR